MAEELRNPAIPSNDKGSDQYVPLTIKTDPKSSIDSLQTI
jgi:hypothetical protein